MIAKGMGPLIEIVEPTVEYRATVEYQGIKPPTAVQSPRPHTLKGKRVLLLANWKPMATPFLESLAQKLAQKAELHSCFVRTPAWNFTHPDLVGKIAPEADDLARQCDLMVSGVAD